ncbi:NAD(P)/FAD-dependent oxidoreductase [Desulforudis sp. 1088]|uniref:NAD(P)/FAD-dependent oxidoreductase n=3 Tax=Candidatus Desulforudis TaxID=471826 RepID=UPI003CE4F5F0
MLRVSGLKLGIDEDESVLPKLLVKRLRIRPQDLLDFKIFKRSIDARDPETVYFVYTVDAAVDNEQDVLRRTRNRRITVTPDLTYKHVPTGTAALRHPPVVVGTGPAGLFAGLVLAEMGYRPLLLERGPDVDTRSEAVERFWATGELHPECNVQFGEGGAGTFSDGKLTTQIRDPRCRKILEEMVEAGAPPEIIYVHKPHVGTDRLRTVVKNIREKIVRLGGTVRFESRVTEILVEDSRIKGVAVNGREKIPAEAVILAIGHSARDTFAMLYEKGVRMTPKPFSIGVRVEHPQQLINQAQHKKFAGHPRLGAADYKLAYHSPRGRSAYTFCMCPGGVVVAATSEEGCVCTNGMSLYARNGENANSAILVGVQPEDYGSGHPLAGVEFQRKWERKAYELGGKDYCAPAQLVGDFLADRPSTGLGRVRPSYRKGVRLAELKNALPDYVVETIREAIPEFDKKLRGFNHPEAVLTGVETRSSSPVRIVRDENFESSIKGLFPAGEGAGYAGGIVSAAVDGIKVAETVAGRYSPLTARQLPGPKRR